MSFLFDDQILFSEYICKTHFRQKEEKKTIYLPGTSASYLSPQINQIAEKVCKEILVWKLVYIIKSDIIKHNIKWICININ